LNAQASGWLKQRLISPLAFRLSATGKDDNSQPAFSVAEALKAPKSLLIIPDGRAGGLFLGASQFWAIRHRYPDASISLLVRSQKEYIAREIPFVDEVISYDDFLIPVGNKLKEVIRRLREHNFDIAFCFSGEENLCPASLCYKSGAQIRIGFQRDEFPFFNIRIIPRPGTCYEPERLSLIPETLGIPQVKERVSWSVSEGGAKKIRDRYLVGRSSDEQFVGLDISSARHRPTFKQIQNLAQLIISLPNTRALVFFDYEERKNANRIRGELGQKVLLFQTDDLPKIVALLEACHQLITCNTDLFHLAVSMGLPITGIFSLGEKARWVPENHEGLEILTCESFQAWGPGKIRDVLHSRLSSTAIAEKEPQ
jgi:ADP-heptose:LPS heptosyltransferase